MDGHTCDVPLPRFIDGRAFVRLPEANPSLIGDGIIRAFDANDGSLPFLFKVLSIEKALSIQTHPDKKTAKKLHQERPDIYKGNNYSVDMEAGSADLVIHQMRTTSRRWQ